MLNVAKAAALLFIPKLIRKLSSFHIFEELISR